MAALPLITAIFLNTIFPIKHLMIEYAIAKKIWMDANTFISLNKNKFFPGFKDDFCFILNPELRGEMEYFYDSLKNIDDLNSIQYDNLEGKNFISISYYDGVSFKTYENLKKINIKDNNIYFPEFPQQAFILFNACQSSELTTDDLARDTGKLEKVCKNAIELNKFKPYALFPCSTHKENVELRNKESYLYNVAYLKLINDNLNPNDYNDLVFFGGKPHSDFMINEFRKNNNLKFRIVEHYFYENEELIY